MIARIWVYLSATPLLWLTATLAAYEAGAWIFGRFGRRPLLNPVLIAVTVLIAVLAATGTPYETYFDGAQFVHFLLGPATVALAVPLFENRAHVRAALLPMLAALMAGSLTAIASAVAIARLLGARGETIASMAPKSVTTPIAMAISEQIGGLPSLTAAFVIATGICGAVIATPLLNLLRLRDYRARGFAAGLAAHGLGTARAFQMDEMAGTFAGIALALNGLATSLLVPALARLMR
ncbi:MAG: LrgB family protein [Deltaproteobacteria bacterium]|nr:MAG: LrgB family protein [Deltaproteobacteria bacterium]TMB35718.1 MAG: LrgB family protein [Deltaproteobacteria bacterium]